MRRDFSVLLGLRRKKGFWTCFSLPSLYILYAAISWVTVRSFGWGAETNPVVAALYLTGWWAALAFHSATTVSLTALSFLMYWLTARPGPPTRTRPVAAVIFSVIFGAVSYPVLTSSEKLLLLFFPGILQHLYPVFFLEANIMLGIPIVLSAILATYLSTIMPREAEHPSEHPSIVRSDRRLALTLYSVVVTSALIATSIYSWQSHASMESQLIEIAIDRGKLMAYRVLADQYSRTTYIYSDKLVYSLGEPVHITLATEFGIEAENLSFRVGDYPGSISVAASKRTPTEGIIPPWTAWSAVAWEVETETLNGTDVTLLLCNPSGDAVGTVVETYTATVGQTVLNISAKPSQRLVMNFTWDQTDHEGRQVQPGVYTLLGYLYPGWNTAQSNIFITQP